MHRSITNVLLHWLDEASKIENGMRDRWRCFWDEWHCEIKDSTWSAICTKTSGTRISVVVVVVDRRNEENC